MTHAANHPSTPIKLPGYQILAMQGQCNMDIEYLAHNKVFNQHVVIKEFFPKALAYRNSASKLQIQDGQESEFLNFKRTFIKTARALSTLAKQAPSQRHIAKTQGLLSFNNTSYMLTDYVKGQSIEQYFEKEKIDGNTLQDIFLPIINELIEHHHQQLFHRHIDTKQIIIDSNHATLVGMGTISEANDITSKASQTEGVISDIKGLAESMYNCIIKQHTQHTGYESLSKTRLPLSALSHLTQHGFSQHFLVAIDRALNLLNIAMPLSLREWKAYLSVSNKSMRHFIPSKVSLSSPKRPLDLQTNKVSPKNTSMKPQTALNTFLGITENNPTYKHGYPFIEHPQKPSGSTQQNYSSSFIQKSKTSKTLFSSAQTTETRDTNMPSNNVDILPMKSASDWLLGAGFTAIAAFVSMGVYLTMSSTLDNTYPENETQTAANHALIAYDHKPYHDTDYEEIDLTQIRNPHLEAAIARVKEGLKMAALSEYKVSPVSHRE